jgi:hypothetical protein
MSLARLFKEGRLREHRSTPSEIRSRLRIVDRNLQDAVVSAISVDLRFHTAYQGAYQLATIALAASGYRTAGESHHRTIFEAVPYCLGPDYEDLASYFDQSRSKRNVLDYDRAGEIAESEVAELLTEVKKFRQTVLAWLRAEHPKLLPR